ATIWACIIPVLLARKSRTLANGAQGFVVPGGNLAL
ncbi:aromatic amino acid transport family protein, partial [Vibrio cholerae]